MVYWWQPGTEQPEGLDECRTTNPLPEGETGLDEGGPDDIGGVTENSQPTETESVEEEPRNYLELDDDVANRYVRVKVDGEETEVPLQEALQGYSRTADYTRKTQQLAEQRQQVEYALAVQRALQAQPEETIRLLSRQYGLQQDQSPQSPPPQQQGWEQPSTYDDGGDDLMDPLERRLNQQQRMLDQLYQTEQQRVAEQRLNTAIGGLQRKYQLNDSDVREVVGTALQARMGPESFEMIYKNIAYDREQQARAEAMATRQQQEQQREAAKTSNQQLVGQGRSANGADSGLPSGTPDGHMSVSEAYEAALREHGAT